MARDESNREDLLREATALVERIELIPLGSAEDQHIVAGFRRDGALSIFFGKDPVYQFNAVGELRRAYCDGRLLKAAHGRLVSLKRERNQNEVQLIRTDLTDAEQVGFLEKMSSRMLELKDWISSEKTQLAGQVPADADVLGRIRNWLSQRSAWRIAARPNV
jgi:hypothetical protein